MLWTWFEELEALTFSAEGAKLRPAATATITVIITARIFTAREAVPVFEVEYEECVRE